MSQDDRCEITLAYLRKLVSKHAPDGWPTLADKDLEPVVRLCIDQRQRAREKASSDYAELHQFREDQREIRKALGLLRKKLPGLIRQIENVARVAGVRSRPTIVAGGTVPYFGRFLIEEGAASTLDVRRAAALDDLIALSNAIEKAEPHLKSERNRGGQESEWGEFVYRLSKHFGTALQLLGLKRPPSTSNGAPLPALLSELAGAVFNRDVTPRAVVKALAGQRRKWSSGEDTTTFKGAIARAEGWQKRPSVK